MPPPFPGTYALLLRLSAGLRVRVLGHVHLLTPGTYVYVGSALGPGGLRARLARHFSKNKRLRWHVDQITRVVAPLLAVYAISTEKLECTLVGELLRKGFQAPVRGFGSSDCSKGCPAHLLACPSSLPACLRLILEAFLELGLRPRLLYYLHPADPL
ncbi:MAG: GIY-YIG nuclease family protein [Thermoprotei archaeon]|nr:MAG: GIY-YIG nuclease family protein [Thermoprotei archaeon]